MSYKYLIDTNHLSRIAQQDEDVIRKVSELGDVIAISSITAGEMYFAAYNSKNQQENLKSFEQLLGGVKIFPVDFFVCKIYGELKAKIFNKYAPRERRKRRNYSFKKIGISDNDLWIASIAKANDLIVVSADKDFERMNDAGCNIQIEQWFVPETVNALQS